MFEDVPHHHDVEAVGRKIQVRQQTHAHRQLQDFARKAARAVGKFRAGHVAAVPLERAQQQAAPAADVQHPGIFLFQPAQHLPGPPGVKFFLQPFHHRRKTPPLLVAVIAGGIIFPNVRRHRQRDDLRAPAAAGDLEGLAADVIKGGKNYFRFGGGMRTALHRKN